LSTIAAIPVVDFDVFLDGNLAFAEYAVACQDGAGWMRYEDVTRDPDGKLRELCGMLGIGFDAGYGERWASYETITGDVQRGQSRGVREARIRPLERKVIDEGLLERFRADDRYQKVCALLGYEV